jgi:mediator of RNA polymerase II transcription subunit 21
VEQANRLQALEQQMQDANEEYIQAVDRASERSFSRWSANSLPMALENLHRKISEFLRTMLDNADGPVEPVSLI